MRDIQKLVDQARELGSHEILMTDEIIELHNRAIDSSGRMSFFNLITDSYDVGFAIGYKLGLEKKEKAATEATT